MSQENVEIVKEVYARGERGDFDGMLALWHPVAEWIEDPRVPGASTYRGYAEIKRYMEGARRSGARHAATSTDLSISAITSLL
jgi:ketosteroid isomerase-like protein